MLRYLYIFRNDDLFVRLEFYSHVVHHFSSLRSGSRSPETRNKYEVFSLIGDVASPREYS